MTKIQKLARIAIELGYNWIAENPDGSIWAFQQKPEFSKDYNIWTVDVNTGRRLLYKPKKDYSTRVYSVSSLL